MLLFLYACCKNGRNSRKCLAGNLKFGSLILKAAVDSVKFHSAVPTINIILCLQVITVKIGKMLGLDE